MKDGHDIRTVQALLEHQDVSTTMIHKYVLNRSPGAVRSPADSPAGTLTARAEAGIWRNDRLTSETRPARGEIKESADLLAVLGGLGGSVYFKLGAEMKPLSRGCPPKEFTLRVPCPLSQQFTVSGPTTHQYFEHEGVRCAMELIDGEIVISASGFSDAASSGRFFKSLQRRFTKVAVDQRIAAAFPARFVEPTVAPLSFIPGDMGCVSHGWPVKPIKPLLVPNNCASIYPEHEYVAITEVVSFTPTFTYPLASLAEQLGTPDLSLSPDDPLDETLLLAAFAYAHASRTTQWVWSFLLTVMTLEMLATQSPTSSETQLAVAELLQHAEEQYKGCQSVDLARMRDCLAQARRVSKTRAVQDLVKKHCAPGVADLPLTDIFTDEADCEKKVAAIYNARSKYLHEGHVKQPTKLQYPFDVLHTAARASLGHILRVLLAS